MSMRYAVGNRYLGPGVPVANAFVGPSQGRALYLSTNSSNVGGDDYEKEPMMAIIHTKCLRSGIERSSAASRIRAESISNAALALDDTQMNA
jgi:hypothetical protein